jgi:hypothetical protein
MALESLAKAGDLAAVSARMPELAERFGELKIEMERFCRSMA